MHNKGSVKCTPYNYNLTYIDIGLCNFDVYMYKYKHAQYTCTYTYGGKTMMKFNTHYQGNAYYTYILYQLISSPHHARKVTRQLMCTKCLLHVHVYRASDFHIHVPVQSYTHSTTTFCKTICLINCTYTVYV